MKKKLPNLKCLICGKDFKPHTFSYLKRGWSKYCSYKCKGIASVGNLKNEKHPLWKGEKVTYSCLHIWVRRYLPKPKTCFNCGTDKNIDAANVSGNYLRDLKDWKWMCRKCHMEEDKRLLNLHENNRRNYA